MKNLLIGVLLALVLIEGYQAYKWKQVADVRGWQAEQVYGYLMQPVAYVNNQPLPRVAVINALVNQATQTAATSQHK